MAICCARMTVFQVKINTFFGENVSKIKPLTLIRALNIDSKNVCFSGLIDRKILLETTSTRGPAQNGGRATLRRLRQNHLRAEVESGAGRAGSPRSISDRWKGSPTRPRLPTLPASSQRRPSNGIPAASPPRRARRKPWSRLCGIRRRSRRQHQPTTSRHQCTTARSRAILLQWSAIRTRPRTPERQRRTPITSGRWPSFWSRRRGPATTVTGAGLTTTAGAAETAVTATF
jgi:hypothetical protein